MFGGGSTTATYAHYTLNCVLIAYLAAIDSIEATNMSAIHS